MRTIVSQNLLTNVMTWKNYIVRIVSEESQNATPRNETLRSLFCELSSAHLSLVGADNKIPHNIIHKS